MDIQILQHDFLKGFLRENGGNYMENRNVISSIFFIILTFIVIGFFTFVLFVFFLLSGHIQYFGLLFTIAILLFLLIIGIYLRFFITKKRKLLFAIISFIAIGIAVISPIRHGIIQKIPTVSSEVDIFEYMPFEQNSKVVTLDEEVTLQLTDNLPKMDGATALYPLYSAIAQATYPEKQYEPYDSEVMVNTTPEAYNNLFTGKVDMIFVAGPSEAQLNRAKQLGLKLHMTPIGREAFVFFVNKKNPINGLTIDQIKNIYSGKIKNWKDVGGNDESIRAFQRPEDSGSQTALQRLMADTPIMDPPRENVASGMGDIISEVANYRNYKNAIGYTFRFYSTEMVGNDEIKLLEINGVAPTKENIQNNSYPITSEFYIITAGTTNPNVDKVIEWVLSEQGQKLVEKVGYVPVKSTN